MMKGISMKKFADRDSQEVRGYFEILENVFNSWKKIGYSTVENILCKLTKNMYLL